MHEWFNRLRRKLAQPEHNNLNTEEKTVETIASCKCGVYECDIEWVRVGIVVWIWRNHMQHTHILICMERWQLKIIWSKR